MGWPQWPATRLCARDHQPRSSKFGAVTAEAPASQVTDRSEVHLLSFLSPSERPAGCRMHTVESAAGRQTDRGRTLSLSAEVASPCSQPEPCLVPLQKIRWEDTGAFLKQTKNKCFGLCQLIRKARLTSRAVYWPVTLENKKKKKEKNK